MKLDRLKRKDMFKKDSMSNPQLMTLATQAIHFHNNSERVSYENQCNYEYNLKPSSVNKACDFLPSISNRASQMGKLSLDAMPSNHERNKINLDEVKQGLCKNEFLINDLIDARRTDIASDNPLSTNNACADSQKYNKSKKSSIMRLLDEAILGRRTQNEYILKMSNKNYIILNEELRNSCFIILKDKQSQRYLVKRKKSIAPITNHEDINLQAKSIQLLKKEKPRSNRIIKVKEPANKADKNYIGEYDHIHRSISLKASKNSDIALLIRKPKSRSYDRNSLLHSTTLPVYFSDIKQKKLFEVHSAERRNSLERKKNNQIEENQSKKKKKYFYFKPKEEKRDEPATVPKKPPVPRFNFVIRQPKEKYEEVKIIEEKPKPRLRQPMYIPADNYLVFA